MHKKILKWVLWWVVLSVGMLAFPDEAGRSEAIPPWYETVPDDLISQRLMDKTVEIFEGLEKTEDPADEKEKEEEKESKEEEVVSNKLRIISQALEGDERHAAWIDGIVDDKEEYKERLCSVFSDICRFTNIDETHSIENIVRYKGGIIYLIQNFEDYLQAGYSVINTMNTLRIQNDDGRRWFAGHSTVQINTKEIDWYQEFLEVLTHEIGHIVDLWVLEGDSPEKHSDFTEFGEEVFSVDSPSIDYYSISWQSENTRSPGSSRLEFVGGYAMTNPFEDFAESVNMYLNHYWVFREMAQTNYELEQKFQFMDNIFQWNYINYDQENKEKIQENPERRPRDTTTMHR